MNGIFFLILIVNINIKKYSNKLKNILPQLSGRIEVMGEEVVRMKKDILEQTKVKTRVELELEGSRAELESTKQQLYTTVEEVEHLRSQNEEKTQKSLREVGEIKTAKKNIEAQLDEAIAERDQLEAFKVELTKSSDEKQAENEEVKQQLRMKEEEIENLTHDMEITRTSHLNKEALLTTANDRIQFLTAQMGAIEDSHRSEVERLEAEGRERLDQLGSAGEEMGRLQAEVAELKAELQRREELCKEHMESLDRLRTDEEAIRVEMKSKLEILENKLIVAQEQLEKEEKKCTDISETVKEHESEIKSLHEELATVKESNEILEELQAKLRSSADEVAELNGQVSAYAEELRGTKEREVEQTQKLQAGVLEMAAKEEMVRQLIVEKESLQEIKDARDTSFEALQTRTSHVSLEHVAAMEKVRLLEENNARLQEEMDKAVEERKSVDEMMIRIGSKEQELQLELQQEKETVVELSNNWDKRRLEIESLEKEKEELSSTIQELQKKLEEEDSEKNHKLEFLQSQLEEMEMEKEETQKNKSVLEKEMLENKEKLKQATQEMEILKTEQRNQSEIVAAEKTTRQAEMERVILEKENLSAEVARLEKELKTEMESKNTLAQSVSQLITDTNAMKNQLRQTQASNEKQQEADAVLEKEREDLKRRLVEAQARTEELQSKVDNGVLLEEKLSKVLEELAAYEAKYNSMQAELATSEIKNSDLEQTLEGKGDEVGKALAEQKERYDKRHKEVIATQAKKWQGKMKEFCEIANEKVTKADEKLAAAEAKVKSQESELKSVGVSNERLKKMVEKMEEAEQLSKKEKEMLETRYTKAREDGKILLAKYERQKEATAKVAEQTADQNEVITIRQELIRVKSENRTLSNQLSYADTRLRELGRHEGFGTSRRESISVPGRVTRQTSSRDSEDSGVFKLPGSQSSQGTPGRTRTTRTVSDTRVARTRPPLGSGSLFHADEEVGEVFSSSYLSDLKDGNCLLDDTGRMSELARRNTLAPAHLKSAYPIESQFFDDNSVTEESLRHSRLPMRQSVRLSTAPGNQTVSFSNSSKVPLNLSVLPADTSRELAGVNSPAVNRLSQVKYLFLAAQHPLGYYACQIYDLWMLTVYSPRRPPPCLWILQQQQHAAREPSRTSQQPTCLPRSGCV